MDSALKPSEWCKAKQEDCLNNGDVNSAMDYYELAKLWMSRNL